MLLAWGGTAAAASRSAGAVYVLTNASDSNAVAVFDRAADGRLSPRGTVATGGKGTGSGLGSQGALVLSRDNRWLFAVNAGSNDISVFEVRRGGLRLADRVASGGSQPISLTFSDDLLYVLNAGGSGNITGFALDDGKLEPLDGSTRLLSNHGKGAAPGPAQVQFNTDGDALVVTEKASNLIDTYTVDDDGIASGPTTHQSAGATPFGFAIDKHDHVLVSEAAGAPNGLSALSSYDLDDEHLATISPSVSTEQGAACWVVVTRNGRYAYTANAHSDSISGYRVGHDGRLTLLAARAGETGAGPIDMALSHHSHFLYALNSGSHTISIFQVRSDGRLRAIDAFGQLPASAVGLAAW
jgi:6-phosphogluconolactonase (cycloisomerase 2 family)